MIAAIALALVAAPPEITTVYCLDHPEHPECFCQPKIDVLEGSLCLERDLPTCRGDLDRSERQSLIDAERFGGLLAQCRDDEGQCMDRASRLDALLSEALADTPPVAPAVPWYERPAFVIPATMVATTALWYAAARLAPD